MAEITPDDLDLRVDIDPTDEMSDHAQQHNAANKAIVDLVNELGGEVDVDGNISGLVGGVPEPQAEDAGKVLATNGTNYDWAQLTTEYLPLAEPQTQNPFGIDEEPASTQQQANTAFYKWIDINTRSIEDLADELGLKIEIDGENIVIEIDPDGSGILDVSKKLDKGDGLEAENARVLELAIQKNAEDISTNTENITINSENFVTLLAELNLTIDNDGNISVKPGDPSNPSLDISSKFDKGPEDGLLRARTYDNAALMEMAIKANAAEIADVGGKIDEIIENELPELQVDLAGYFPKYAEDDDVQEALLYPTASEMGTAVAQNVNDISTETSERIAGDENTLKEVAKKYDAGDVPEGENRTYANAYVLEQAVEKNAENIATNATNIEENKTNIENVVGIIGGEVTDGNITLPDPIDIDSKLDKGTDLVAQDAKELEDAIGENAANISANAANIEAVVEVLGGTIDNISGIEIDALPPQDGADGKFLTTDGSVASWADIDIPDALPDGGNEGEFLSLDDKGDAVWVDADVFPKGTSSYDDAGAMEDALKQKIDELEDELSGVVTPVGTATYNVKQSGAAESGDAVTTSLNPAVIAQITFGLVDANGNSTNFAGVSTGDTLKIDNNKGATGEHTIAGHYMVSRSVQLDPVQGPNGEWIQRWTTEPVHYVMQLQDGSGEGTLTEGESVEFSILGVGEGRAVSAEYVDAQDAKKFDLAGIDGEGPLALTNARVMESAIAETINNLGWTIEVSADGGVTIQPPGGGDTESLEDKLSRGDTTYKDAKDIEDAINNIQGFETLTFVDSVATFDELPDPADGKDKMYFVEDEGVFYASNGTEWIKLSEFGITADEIAEINNQLADKFNLKDDTGEAPQFYLNALLVENSLDRKDTQLTILVNALGYEWGTDENGQPVLVPIGGGGDGVEESILATKFDKGTSEDNELSYADAYHMGLAIDDNALKVSTLEEKVESLETNTPEGLATEEYVDNALIPYAKQEDLTLLAAEVELKATLMHVTQAEYDNLMGSDSIDKNTLYVVSAQEREWKSQR